MNRPAFVLMPLADSGTRVHEKTTPIIEWCDITILLHTLLYLLMCKRRGSQNRFTRYCPGNHGYPLFPFLVVANIGVDILAISLSNFSAIRARKLVLFQINDGILRTVTSTAPQKEGCLKEVCVHGFLTNVKEIEL